MTGVSPLRITEGSRSWSRLRAWTKAGQGVLLVVHPVQGDAVGAAHRQERAPLVDDEVVGRLR